MSNQQPQPVNVNVYGTLPGHPLPPQKSPGLAALLGFLFGPLGMLYATVPGAAVMFGAEVLAAVIGAFTGGVGFFVLIPFLVIACTVWPYNAAKDLNRGHGSVQAATSSMPQGALQPPPAPIEQLSPPPPAPPANQPLPQQQPMPQPQPLPQQQPMPQPQPLPQHRPMPQPQPQQQQPQQQSLPQRLPGSPASKPYKPSY